MKGWKCQKSSKHDACDHAEQEQQHSWGRSVAVADVSMDLQLASPNFTAEEWLQKLAGHAIEFNYKQDLYGAG